MGTEEGTSSAPLAAAAEQQTADDVAMAEAQEASLLDAQIAEGLNNIDVIRCVCVPGEPVQNAT